MVVVVVVVVEVVVVVVVAVVAVVVAVVVKAVTVEIHIHYTSGQSRIAYRFVLLLLYTVSSYNLMLKTIHHIIN